MRMLVVDDDIVSRKKLLAMLKPFGDCDSKPNGEGALESVGEAIDRGTPYDLLFLDIEMPNMDGMSVLQKIRELEDERKVAFEKRAKVIMVTVHAEENTVISCLEQGCNDYIVKPFNKEMILKKISRFVAP
jgi:two-component system, chemotaxis family, chemotaxis protein CheY